MYINQLIFHVRYLMFVLGTSEPLRSGLETYRPFSIFKVCAVLGETLTPTNVYLS